MNVLRQIIEQKVPKFTQTQSGCEVLNDSNDMKIVLRRTLSSIDNVSQFFYVAQYFIWEENGWVKTSESKTYDSVESFMRDISIADEFSEAMNDYSASLHENV